MRPAAATSPPRPLRQFIVPGSYAGGFALALMAMTCVPPMLQAHAGVRVGQLSLCAGLRSARWRRWSRAWTTRDPPNTWSG